jgi:hypothetical protein
MEVMAAEDEATNRLLPTDEHPASSPILRKSRGAPIVDVTHLQQILPEEDKSSWW